MSIYGELYLPNGVERPKLIIYAHEIGCTHTTSRAYAAHLAGRGYAFFAPDFRGGGERSKSEGDTVDMSVLTEVEDLGRYLTRCAAGTSWMASGLCCLGLARVGSWRRYTPAGTRSA